MGHPFSSTIMDTLLTPHYGLLFWTAVSFIVLVALLRSFAWGPLIGMIEEREAQLRRAGELAEQARRDAENAKAELEARLARSESEMKEMLAQAAREGEALKADLKKEADEESRRVMERTRLQLEDERRRVVGELRGEVASLSVAAAERLMRKSVDPGVRQGVMERFFEELDRGRGKA